MTPTATNLPTKIVAHFVPEGISATARRTAGQIVAAVDRAAVNGPDRFAADCLSVFLRANRRALERHIAERLARESKGGTTVTYLDLDDAPACQPIRPPRGEGLRAGVYRRFKRADVVFRQRHRRVGVWWLPGMSR